MNQVLHHETCFLSTYFLSLKSINLERFTGFTRVYFLLTIRTDFYSVSVSINVKNIGFVRNNDNYLHQSCTYSRIRVSKIMYWFFKKNLEVVDSQQKQLLSSILKKFHYQKLYYITRKHITKQKPI